MAEKVFSDEELAFASNIAVEGVITGAAMAFIARGEVSPSMEHRHIAAIQLLDHLKARMETAYSQLLDEEGPVEISVN